MEDKINKKDCLMVKHNILARYINYNAINYLKLSVGKGIESAPIA